ncbi:sigma-70 family RNA polymerase sigma factor [Virgibacillus sp. C22-A2]|uniref:RNA polymerase sigma factor n=1 Tax=Virgibacillus tibetensis TaxID=3042313 RepID=A0ABU6KK00_9BACI|nr:sigma-70 family RNA polymerase sigma factor [Virgibacillus sp. C22-A2]
MKEDTIYSTQKVTEDLFYDLVNQYGEELIRVAYLYVKNSFVAEDIVQEVFMSAFEQIQKFKGKSTYKTYLYRITINKCHDYFRSWSYKNMVLSETITNFIRSSDKTEEKIIMKDEAYTVGKTVLSLPLKYREVIILYYYKDFSINEITKMINCSQNTVKTRLRRARMKLRGKLETSEGGKEIG